MALPLSNRGEMSILEPLCEASITEAEVNAEADKKVDAEVKVKAEAGMIVDNQQPSARDILGAQCEDSIELR